MSDEELTEHWQKRAEARWQTDFDDLNRERAGVHERGNPCDQLRIAVRG